MGHFVLNFTHWSPNSELKKKKQERTWKKIIVYHGSYICKASLFENLFHQK